MGVAESPNGSFVADVSDWRPPTLLLVAIGALAIAIVVFVGLYALAYFWWHPVELHQTSSGVSTQVMFETKAPLAVALLQGLGGVIGVLLVAMVTALVLWWVFRERLRWPGVVMIPIWTIASLAAAAMAIAVGAGVIGVRVDEKVTIDRELDVVELRKRSLIDFLRSGGGHRSVVRFADIQAVEYVHNLQLGATLGHDEAETRLRLTTGPSVGIPSGAQPDSAYRLAVAIAEAAQRPVKCFRKDDRASPTTPMGCP